MTGAPTTAVARRDASRAALTKDELKDRKAFLEAVQRTDLGQLSADQQRAMLISYGQHTGLRPEHGEVMIFQGRFYVTMLGRIRNAHSSGLYDGETTRPVAPTEKANAGYATDDIVWKATVYRRGAAMRFEGWGKVTAVEISTANKHTPLFKHPVEMARKRALYDALRNAFPLDEDLSGRGAHLIVEAETIVEQRRIGATAEQVEELEEVTRGRELEESQDAGAEADLYQDALVVAKAATPDARRRLIQKDALQTNLSGEDLDAIILRVTGKSKLPEITEDPDLVAKVLVAIANVAAERDGQ